MVHELPISCVSYYIVCGVFNFINLTNFEVVNIKIIYMKI